MNTQSRSPSTPSTDAHWNHDVDRYADDRYCHTCGKWVGR